MSPEVGFVSMLLVTLAFLGAVVATGLRAQRKRHLVLVAGAVASLGVTIYYAEKLGGLYDLEAAGAITPVHLAMAKLTTLSYLLPIVTGIRTIRNPRTRPLHRKVAFVVLA